MLLAFIIYRSNIMSTPQLCVVVIKIVLIRCLVLVVQDANGSIVQFCYGEDGVDVHQTSFLNKFEALAKNRETIGQKFHHKLEYNAYIKKLPTKLTRFHVRKKFFRCAYWRITKLLSAVEEEKKEVVAKPVPEPEKTTEAASVKPPKAEECDEGEDEDENLKGVL
ncbi:hypothetical protein POM88_007002 [Heracleum sosnowskyi]|uniref:DNA-directed RNA polymerase n=1 Tax=Heracleum sosnowskyi TaxID=360622 RepID=A0AAD8J5A0_9APIA|nr:hypothetical protein POM88_007002 [Heracleum sosnowskyi]